ncbi:MAG: hypothetical protein DRN99_08300 [Thermoproteota archaeon]|nr:MAG: hypothetical protein DRN99_08300 [Candidatus Korarchaeota archaeon]
MQGVHLKRGYSELSGNHVLLGIRGLDEEIGGVPRGSVIAVAGWVGTGKTTLATQFLVEGVKNKERGMYVCTTERVESYVRNMEKLGWPISKFVKSKMLITVRVSKIHESRPQDMIEKLLSIIDTIDIKRLVLDSYTTLTSYFKESWSARLFTYLLLEYLGEKNCTTLLVVETDNDREPRLGDVGFLCDGVIHLRTDFSTEPPRRKLRMLKLRGTRIPLHNFEYEIGEGGIVVLRR